jgi:hypothetical protein
MRADSFGVKRRFRLFSDGKINASIIKKAGHEVFPAKNGWIRARGVLLRGLPGKGAPGDRQK